MAGITIGDLSKTYTGADQDMAAVAGLSLDIRDNEFVTLLGPSGCGKTTTLRLIAGYLRPDTGTIHVNDRLLSSRDHVVPPEERGMGMVFQNYAVWPHKTVYENVVFGLKLRRMAGDKARARVAETLALVNLTGYENRYPNELSGGQQQRVALARSLVVEPEILLLDEPLSNLDAKLRERMRTELKQLQRRTGITFVYVTHDQAEALALSDHVAVIHGGRLQQYGTPLEVYSKPSNRLVADFMGLVNLIPGTVAEVAGGRGTVLVGDHMRLDVPVPDGAAKGEPIEVAIRPENIRLVRPNGAAAPLPLARVSDRTFLGNITEYYAALDSGPVLRIQAHPLQEFAVGDTVAVHVDASQCSVFRGRADQPLAGNHSVTIKSD
jgi:iron(III) transport system ATP-binding protein